jgi:uncharacterized membrane protein YidH (DUF202 family)
MAGDNKKGERSPLIGFGIILVGCLLIGVDIAQWSSYETLTNGFDFDKLVWMIPMTLVAIALMVVGYFLLPSGLKKGGTTQKPDEPENIEPK